MKNKIDNTNQPKSKTDNATDNEAPGYPLYPDSEDIYRKSYKEADIVPEEVSKLKDLTEEDRLEIIREKNFNEDSIGSELDISGSDLDDMQEEIGSEDEENNYYSIGGDNHDDLEEDRGE